METNDPKPAPVPSGEPGLEPPVQPAAAIKPNCQWVQLLNWKVLVPLGALLAVFAALHSLRARANLTAEVPSAVPVAVARVTRENLVQEQDFEGEFRPYQEIDLHAKVAGFVRSINVDIGDQVHQGDLLATLEIPELREDIEKARAQETRNEKEIQRADAAHVDAHLNYTRLQAVNKTKPNLIAQQDLDTAQARDSASDAALAVAKQEVEVSKAELAKLQAVLDYCKITAPFAGVITKRYADEGALVQGGVGSGSAGMPLVRLSQNDRLRLDFPVSVSYIGRVKTGDPVEIKIPSLDRTLAGKISRFTRKVNTDTRTMEVEADVPNSSLELTPGIYATAALQLERREMALAVPVEAVANRKAPTVLTVDKDNVLEERPVTLGLETADRLEIVTGLKENELVLLGNRSQFKPGMKVQPNLQSSGAAL